MINLRTLTNEMKCHSMGEDDSFSCRFVDSQGIEKEIGSVRFLNYDINGTRFEFYKDSDAKEVAFKASFSTPANCEILGLYKNRTATCVHDY